LRWPPGRTPLNKQADLLISRLAGFKPSEFHPEYIAQHLQKANQGLEIQNQITDEITKQIQLYNSAAKNADRVADATRRHYEHLRKMNELSNAPESVKAQRRIRLDAEERNQGIVNKQQEVANLNAEGQKAQQRATAILTWVSSKSQDEAVISKNKAYLAAADKAISDLNEFKHKGNPTGISKDQLFRAYNAATDSGVSGADLDAAEKKLRQDRAGYEKSHRDSVDRSAANDTTRKTGEDFAKQAAKSFSDAVQIRLNLPELQNDVANQNVDESAEESAKAEKEKEPPGYSGKIDATDWEKHGGSCGGAGISMLDVGKQQLRHLASIDQQVGKIGGGNKRGPAPFAPR
jgi:hypothetical protein